MQTMEHKNIVIFMTDHQRWDMMPPFDRCITPNFDRLFRESKSFVNAYCPSPHCCPSRATFHSGLYPSEHGVWNNVNVGNTLSAGLTGDVRLWSQDLKEAGYRLLHCGKWHVSAEQGPEDFGWENIYGNEKYTGLTSGRARPDPKEWKRYTECHSDEAASYPGRQPGEILREGYPPFRLYGETEHPFRDDETVDRAVEQVHALAAETKPWVLYCGVLGPHDPYCVPKRFLDLYDPDAIELPASYYDTMLDKPNLYRRTREKFGQLTPQETKDAIRHYLAFCSYEDALFGRLADALRANGLYDDAIILCLSDHGDYAGEHGLFAKGLPCFRSAYHIPLMIRWPGLTTGDAGGRLIEDFVTLADLAPTVLDMAGIAASRPFSGASLRKLLAGVQDDFPRDAMYTQSNGNELYGIQRSVMTREWKYVYNGFDYDELYHLSVDPDEMVNLSGDSRYRETKRELAKRLWQFAYDHGDVCVNPYVMVSLAEFGPGIIFDDDVVTSSSI